MTATGAGRGFDWEAAGRELGESLGGYHAIVVIGMNPVTTGQVAVGIGRAQAAHRRVAVGDLFAESPPIQELVQTEDPHGLVDSFLYGVSLTRIAYEVPGAGQLYVMPSGTEPPTYEEILPNPRWHRLAAGFREVQALLVLAAPASAPHIEQLVAATDGAVLVGEAVPPQLAVSRVIGSVREPNGKRLTPILGVPHVDETPAAPSWSRRKKIAAIVGIVLTLSLAAVAAWLAYRPLADSSKTGGEPDCNAQAKAGRPCAAVRPTNVIAIAPDSTAADSARAAAAAFGVPAVTNPADSATASTFAVELMTANTLAGAILKLQTDGKQLPAATFAPTIIRDARWFKVLSGAFTTTTSADSLRAELVRRKADVGGVVKVPFAFLVDSVPGSAAAAMVATYVERGQPVYALRQTNGSAWLLLGAFESAEQAALSVESLRAAGFQPVLVYRKGRSF